MANESQTQYPNYATERSHWHLKSGTERNAMDSLLADWFSAGRDPLSAQHPAFLCHVVRASTCTSRDFNER
jgi:hypothetical protein